MNSTDASSSLPSIVPDPAPAPARAEPRVPLDRRAFLGGLGAASVLLGSAAAGQTVRGGARGTRVALPAPTGLDDRYDPKGDQSKGPLAPKERRTRAWQLRVEAAEENRMAPLVAHKTNGDLERYSDLRASYSKGLPHDAVGEVDPVAFQSLCDALESGSPSDFEAIVLGNPGGSGPPPGITPVHRMINPQAGLGFDMEGVDSHQVTIPPAPAFASAWQAGEAVENYWMAHLRDVPFRQYASHPLVAAALADLNALSDYRGPREGGLVTAQTLFRDGLPGCTVGPYLSQFFWLPQPFGAQAIDPRARTVAAGLDYLIDEASWLARQNGVNPAAGDALDGLVYLRNGRDIGQWVHVDVLFQAYFQAFLTLASLGVGANPGNPYNASATQVGFGTLGGPHVAALLCEVATRALKAVWFQKWYVHLRLRPEVFGARIHFHLSGQRSYDVHPEALGSAAVAEAFSRNGTYLLPMAFPEGSPAHPSYGAGHATVAGACVTMLKAMFDAEQPVGSFFTPVEASDDGLSLTPIAPDPSMTIAGELNKLASNVATGRNIAGVHWRTDGIASLRLGEEVAISVLRDQKRGHNESYPGFTFTRFDGTSVTV